MLPGNHFKDGVMIMQVVKWVDQTYLIVVADEETGVLSAYRVMQANSVISEYQVNESTFNIEPVLYPFLQN